MSDITTRGVRVQVKSAYVREKSSPADNYYFFAYTIRITNHGSVTVQLVSRKWIISGPEGEVGRVDGLGVVGEQPVLQPGEAFEYTSGCPLETPSGHMQGRYEMRTAGGSRFHAEIPRFALRHVTALH